MALASAQLSSASFFTQPLYALEYTTRQIESSVLKLSTGSRISRAGDDVAAFSIATRLQSQLSTLKQASRNAVQADSLLQVAQGGLNQIIELLDRNTAIATQANSASLTSADRSYLQAEFAGNLSEIDRIATTTSFNNIALLDGTLSGENKAITTTTAATKAAATLTFSTAANASDAINLNGVTFTEGVGFAAGATGESTVDNLLVAIAASTDTRITQSTYTKSGSNAIIITNKAGGALGNQYTISKAGYTASLTSSGASTQSASITTLTGGLNNGLNIGSVISSGTIGDALVNTQSQTKGSVTLSLSGAAINNETLNIDDGNGSLLTFTFKTTAATSTEIQIGADTEATLQNAINTITQYSGTSNFVTRQLDFRIDGNSLIISNKTSGNAKDFAGNVPDITETLTNGALSAATITGGTTTGINTSGVTNKDFVGSISGFTASYVGADSINASLTVGDSTYTASITDTTPSSNTTVRFSSTSGGYFDVQLAASQGQAVTNSSTAIAYAARLNSAIAGLTFSQSRSVSNFEATGAFAQASANLQLADFTDVRIDSLAVTAPVSAGQDATIDVVINNEIFRASSGIRGTLGSYETLTLTSTTNANNVLKLKNGSTAQDFSGTTAAADFESDLRNAFGLGDVGSGVDFQVGVANDNKVNVVVNSSTADSLFNGNNPSVNTQDNAADAQTSLDTARASVLENLANVGALQSRFQSVQAVNAKVIEGLTNARSILTDTDIAEESTNYAQYALRLNAGIAVIAQTQNLQSSLLNILQSGNN